MTQKEASKMRLAAARVGARAKLIDLRVRRISAELQRASVSPPLEFQINVNPSLTRLEALAIFDLDYEFSAQDSDEQTVLAGSLTLSVLYELPADEPISDEELTSFGEVSVVFSAHPYVREILHSLTGRMGLPPLLLDLMQSPLDDELRATD